MIRFTKEEVEWLKSYIPGHSYADIAETFSQQFRPITSEQAHAFCKNRHIPTGRKGYFKKGHPSWNKGKHPETRGRMAETQFKPGNIPHNYKPVGSERITCDGYVEVKIADPNKWRLKHRVVWEEHNGPVPRGYSIIFKDGDRTNCTIDNLIMLTRDEHALMTIKRLRSHDPELTDAGYKVIKLSKRLRELRNYDYARIGDRVRMILAERGMSIADLASLVGVSRATMSANLCGRCPIPEDRLEKVMEVLGVTKGELIND